VCMVWCGVDTMVDWDEEKLEQVVAQKHAESDMKKPKTEIVRKLSRYFMSAFVIILHLLLPHFMNHFCT